MSYTAAAHPALALVGGMQSDTSNWARSHRNGNGSSAPGGRKPRFPHLKTLQDEAAHLDVDENSPIYLLIDRAREAISKCKVLIEQGHPDLAYVQYLRASEVTINIIPRHREFKMAATQRPAWYDQFTDLMLAIRTKQSSMDSIKKQIVEDNLENYNTGNGPALQNGPSPLKMPDPSDFVTSNPSINHSELSQKLPGRPSTDDTLAQRFERLRMTPSAPSRQAQHTSAQNDAASPSSTLSASPQYLPRNVTSSPYTDMPRPQGPRMMGSAPNSLVSSARPSMEAAQVPLPRAPDPAYNPVLTIPSQQTPNPPRTSADSVRAQNPKYTQLLGSPRGSPSRSSDYDTNPYRSRTPNGFHLAQEIKSSSSDLPHNPTIQAQQLLDYMRNYNILVIDARPRDQYDSGHIYAKSIICIEPVALKENVSAEELEERLVVSPEHEQSLFERRNEFDLVVYYDQTTSSVSYLVGSPVGTSAPHLRALYDTLYEFNAYKPLKDGRPPALLVGGLDSWVDLVGKQSLATSSTAAIMGSLQPKRPIRPGRPIGRVPMASANSSLEVRKRRLREFTPLNPDELSAWMERAKNEEIDTNSYEEADGSLTEEPEQLDYEPEVPSPFVHTYEDFLRRFPEPHAIQESMVVPATGRTTVPTAPNYATPVPVVPSRPPPAVPRPSYGGVSEGRQIQPTLERQNSATKTALYTSSSLLNRFKLPRTGLHNFGVTCYMNSTIQCLNATLMLSKFFIDNRFRYYIQKNWKGSQGVMPGLFANLIRALWKNDVEIIMPTSFRNFCGRLNREWGIDRQQDAKEFFDFLVDCLHEDLNINWQRTPLRPLTFDEEMQRERMPVVKVSKIEWDRYSHREESFISSLFAGQHASRLRCTTCKRTSTTYEAFYSISIEIPTVGNGDIYSCLRSYCQEEMLSGDEVWKCPYCKCEREATKQIIITRAPQILVVHFKRFSASKTQSARKIHTPVDFPLHGLRMDNFVIPYLPSENLNGDQVSSPSLANTQPGLSPTTPPFNYDAYAVLRHLGSSMSSGHYISLVRDGQRQCWRKFDDDRVTDFNPRDLRFSDRLQNEQAYIVFYERVPAK